MIEKNKLYIWMTLTLLTITGCAQIFNDVVLPNQCMECKIINTTNGNVKWSDKGCGGDKTKMDKNAKLKAYDLNHEGNNPCIYRVECRQWRKEKDD